MHRSRAAQRLLLAALAALALLPLAAALDEPAPTARETTVVASQAPDGNEWVVSQLVAPRAGDAEAFAWVPRDAQRFTLAALPPNATLRWSFAGEDRVRVAADRPVDSIHVQFSLARHGGLPPFVAPQATERLVARVQALEGYAPAGDEWTLAGDELRLERASVAQGDELALSSPPPRPAGARALLAQIGVASALALAGGGAYAALRAPRASPEREMRLLDHLRELQARLLPVVIAFALAAAFFFTFGVGSVEVRGVQVPIPVVTIEGAAASIAFRVLAHQFAPAGVTLVVLSPGDAALAQILMGLVLAFVAVLPLLAWQIAAFLGPGLHAKEKRLALRAVPAVLLLFLGGVAFAWTLMVPLTVTVLYSYAAALGAVPLLTVDSLAKFSAIMLLLFGATFELPVVMVALARLGLVSARGFAGKWRHAVVAIFVLAAIVTPDGTGITMVLLGVPLVALYMVGIVAAKAAEKKSPA